MAVVIKAAIVRDVPAAEAFTTAPPEDSVLISSGEIAALSIGGTLCGVFERADGGATKEGIRNPFAVVLGVGLTRRFGDVLTRSAAAT